MSRTVFSVILFYNKSYDFVGLDWVSFGIDDLEVGLFVMSEYQNSLPQLLENEEHNSDTCSIRNVLWFDISLHVK